MPLISILKNFLFSTLILIAFLTASFNAHAQQGPGGMPSDPSQIPLEHKKRMPLFMRDYIAAEYETYSTGDFETEKKGVEANIHIGRPIPYFTFFQGAKYSKRTLDYLDTGQEEEFHNVSINTSAINMGSKTFVFFGVSSSSDEPFDSDEETEINFIASREFFNWGKSSLGFAFIYNSHSEISGIRGLPLILPSYEYNGDAASLKIGYGINLTWRFTQRLSYNLNLSDKYETSFSYIILPNVTASLLAVSEREEYMLKHRSDFKERFIYETNKAGLKIHADLGLHVSITAFGGYGFDNRTFTVNETSLLRDEDKTGKKRFDDDWVGNVKLILEF